VDILWSPWRYDYIAGKPKPTECIFCTIAADTARDEENFVLTRADHNFVVLNVYPYTSGHLMVVPYDHAPYLDVASQETTAEMMELIRSAQAALQRAYQPDGINIGMNLGKAAGAGVDAHIHMHLLPRWVGDVNFMTAVGQTRTLPESLKDTYEKLRHLV
jgi:ATP adenylyltransferase